MKLIVMNRNHKQHGIDLKFKVKFTCSKCKKEVEPNELLIGRAHVYALHCDVQQEIGCVA